MIIMGIQEDILASFFQSLGDNIPETIINPLRVMLVSQNIVSKEEIFDILKEGEQDIDRDIQD
jgi:hypothetical protein